MIDKRALSIMADIMDGIEQTDEWTEFQMNDPGIKDADSRLNRALDAAEKYIPREVYADVFVLTKDNMDELPKYGYNF